MRRKVMVGGVFAIVHSGHVFFLKKAKELGDYLIVVVASDRTAKLTKKYEVPPAIKRKKSIERLGFVDKVVIGDDYDFMKVVRREKPSVIALGYDQKLSEKKIRELAERSGVKCDVIRIKEYLKGYKTSKIMKEKKKG